MARQIQRYEIGPAIISNEAVAVVRLSDSGEWVLWSDVAPILAEVDKPAHNTGSPKLPTLAECQAHVQREMWGSHMLANSTSITERVYDFICRQLSA
jgi:hypothetical protein